MTERGESEFSLSLSNYSHDDNMKQFSLPQMNQTKVSLDKLIDPTLLKIEVFMMSVAFTLSLIGNLIVIITLLVRHFIKPKKLTKTQTNKSFYSSNQANSNNAANNNNNNNGNVSQFKTRKFTRMNFYILNLSIADVYVSLGNILTMLLWRRNNNLFYGDDLACRLVAYFQLVSVYYSTYVLMTMTLDRYEAICKPLFSLSWSKARGFAYIFGAFVVSHLQGIPQLMFFALRELKDVEPSVVTCLAEFSPPWLQNVYIIYTWFMQFLIPLCVIIVCYASISVKVFSNRNDMARSTIKYTSKLAKNDPSARKTLLASSSSQGNEHQLHSPVDGTETPRSKKDNVLSFRQHGRKNFSKSKIKTIKLTLTVIILYVICSTPYFVGMIIHLMSSAMKLGTAIIILLSYLQLKCVDGCTNFPAVMKHCVRTFCGIVENKETSTFKCDVGYEFKAGITEDSFDSVDGNVDEIVQCNAIGCKVRDIPSDGSIDPDANVIVTKSVCIPAVLPAHCKPEESYVDLKCKPGFKMDDDTGFLKVKCLLSYLWDTVPECDIPTDENEVPKPPEPPKATTANMITNKTTAASSTTTLIKTSPPVTTKNNPAITTTSTKAAATTATTNKQNPPTSTALVPSTFLITTAKSNDDIKNVSAVTAQTSKLSAVYTASMPTLNARNEADNRASNIPNANNTLFSSKASVNFNTTIPFNASNAATTAATATTTAPGAATPAPGAATPAPGAATPAPGAATTAPGAATTAPGATTNASGAATIIPGAATTSNNASTSASGSTATVSGAAATSSANQASTNAANGALTIVTSGVGPTNNGSLTTANLASSTASRKTDSVSTWQTTSILTAIATTSWAKNNATATQQASLTSLALQSQSTAQSTLSNLTSTYASAKEVTSVKYNVCFDVYPKPLFYNRTNIKFNLVPHEIIQNVYMPGSQITFTCLKGFYTRNNRNLTITCLPSGKWSNVSNCEMHPCWSRLPPRPLNGRREVGLIMQNTDFISGSHVNFSCNPYFELRGRARLFCVNGVWESEIPSCVLRENICETEPKTRIGYARIMSQTKHQIKKEFSYTASARVFVYVSADYVCMRGYQFPDSNTYREFNGTSMSYQTSKCSGANIWSSISNCVPT